MNLKPGKYKAKINEYGVTLTKAGQPQVRVQFSVENGESISWFGGLASEAQQAITTKALFTMGANTSTIEKVELGKSGGALNSTKTYELVIEENEYQGKKSMRVKFINDPEKVSENAPKPAPKGSLSALKGMAASLIARGEVTENKNANDAGF